MRVFNIYIDISNDAFEPQPGPEIARILRELADKLEDGISYHTRLMDCSGNIVGVARVTEDNNQ